MKFCTYLTFLFLCFHSIAMVAHSSQKDTLASIEAGDVFELRRDLEVAANYSPARLTHPLYSERFGISTVNAQLMCALSFPKAPYKRTLPARTQLKISAISNNKLYTGPLTLKYQATLKWYTLDLSSPLDTKIWFKLSNLFASGHKGSYQNQAFRASIEPTVDFEYLEIHCYSSAKITGSIKYTSQTGVRYLLDFVHTRASKRKFTEQDLEQFFRLRK